jgi:hypothetical protein
LLPSLKIHPFLNLCQKNWWRTKTLPPAQD